jgi:hypothetical protein
MTTTRRPAAAAPAAAMAPTPPQSRIDAAAAVIPYLRHMAAAAAAAPDVDDATLTRLIRVDRTLDRAETRFERGHWTLAVALVESAHRMLDA